MMTLPDPIYPKHTIVNHFTGEQEINDDNAWNQDHEPLKRAIAF